MRVWTKRQFIGNFEKLLKLLKFINKIAKMHYFSIFSKKLTNHALIFCAFGRKTQIVGKSFQKTFENFEIFLQKIAKMQFLAYCSNKLTNYALIFCAFGRKTQIVGKLWENVKNFWWKFYRIIEFFYFLILLFRNFVTKNRALGNTTIFLEQSFRF